MSSVGRNSYKDSDGKAVEVTLSYTVEGNRQVVQVENLFGLTMDSGDSGDTIALEQDYQTTYQLAVPSGLSVSKGDILYIDTDQITGHTPDDAAWAVTFGGNKVAVFRAVEAKDANNVVIGRFIWQ